VQQSVHVNAHAISCIPTNAAVIIEAVRWMKLAAPSETHTLRWLTDHSMATPTGIPFYSTVNFAVLIAEVHSSSTKCMEARSLVEAMVEIRSVIKQRDTRHDRAHVREVSEKTRVRKQLVWLSLTNDQSQPN
jgi:hypothetical protein